MDRTPRRSVRVAARAAAPVVVLKAASPKKPATTAGRRPQRPTAPVVVLKPASPKKPGTPPRRSQRIATFHRQSQAQPTETPVVVLEVPAPQKAPTPKKTPTPKKMATPKKYPAVPFLSYTPTPTIRQMQHRPKPVLNARPGSARKARQGEVVGRVAFVPFELPAAAKSKRKYGPRKPRSPGSKPLTRQGHIRSTEEEFFNKRFLPNGFQKRRRLLNVSVLNIVKDPELRESIDYFVTNRGGVILHGRQIPSVINHRIHVVGDDENVLYDAFLHRRPGTKGLGFLRFSRARDVLSSKQRGRRPSAAGRGAYTKRAFDDMVLLNGDIAPFLRYPYSYVVLNLVEDPKARRAINRFVTDHGGHLLRRPTSGGLPSRFRRDTIVIGSNLRHLKELHDSARASHSLDRVVFVPGIHVAKSNPSYFKP